MTGQCPLMDYKTEATRDTEKERPSIWEQFFNKDYWVLRVSLSALPLGVDCARKLYVILRGLEPIQKLRPPLSTHPLDLP